MYLTKYAMFVPRNIPCLGKIFDGFSGSYRSHVYQFLIENSFSCLLFSLLVVLRILGKCKNWF